ncbi:serine carboxypeptidase-like 51 [Rutidosis leptorrhynchoides]|uniref:serine carboxypeptidase-like 51 n=1 Tax=Rutidosis leptorrhynchoides TaxID=125765 RepID=UPI003A9A651E
MANATETWSDLEGVVGANSNYVDFYNFLLHSDMDQISMTDTEIVRGTSRQRYSIYLDSLMKTPDRNGGLNLLMNLDVICATKGGEAWVEKLKWEGLKIFLNIDKTPLYCGDDKSTKGFTTS